MLTLKNAVGTPAATERIKQIRRRVTYPEADLPVREPAVRAIVDETLPLIGAVPFYGPPVVALAGPVVLLSLLIAGPFALVATIVALIVVVIVAAVALVAVVGAILAAPVLLVRRFRVPAVTTRARLRSSLVHERPARPQAGGAL